MKILIDKIDDAILSALQDKPATKRSSPPDQPTAESAFSVCWLRSVANNADGGENRIAIKSAYPGLM
jgi:hypothetical protein